MTLRTKRLSVGEWLLGGSSVLLLIDLFGVTWFAYQPRFHTLAAMLGQSSSASGWSTFAVIGPLALIVCIAGIAVFTLTLACSSPALPVVSVTLLLPVSFVLAVLVAIRVLLDVPSVHLVQAGGANVIEARAGAYLGLALSIAIFLGSYLTMRRDDATPADSPSAIETVRIGR